MIARFPQSRIPGKYGWYLRIGAIEKWSLEPAVTRLSASSLPLEFTRNEGQIVCGRLEFIVPFQDAVQGVRIDVSQIKKPYRMYLHEVRPRLSLAVLITEEQENAYVGVGRSKKTHHRSE